MLVCTRTAFLCTTRINSTEALLGSTWYLILTVPGTSRCTSTYPCQPQHGCVQAGLELGLIRRSKQESYTRLSTTTVVESKECSSVQQRYSYRYVISHPCVPSEVYLVQQQVRSSLIMHMRVGK